MHHRCDSAEIKPAHRRLRLRASATVRTPLTPYSCGDIAVLVARVVRAKVLEALTIASADLLLFQK